MRVWIVNPYDNLPPEGYRPQRFWLMARAFAAAGCETVLWTSSFSHANKRRRRIRVEESEEGLVRGDGFDVRLVPAPGYRANIGLGRLADHLVLAKRWRNLAETAERPDLIIVSSPPLGLVAAARRFAQAHGLPYAVDVMDAWPETFERVVPRFVLKMLGLYRMARKNYLGAARISTVANRYMDLVRQYGYRGPVREFLHGIERYGVQRCGTVAGSETLRLVYAGNMSLSYDLETVIRAVREMEGVSLDIAGDGPDRDKLESLARGEGERGRIRFHGYLGEKELVTLLAACDVGVVPMWPASCVGVPYKLGDYAAAGLRIVESLGGECQAIVGKYGAGAHYEAGDAESFKAAIRATAGIAFPHEKRDAFAQLFDARAIMENYVKWMGDAK